MKLFIIVHFFIYAQNVIKELKPDEITPLNLSTEGAQQFEKNWQPFNAVAKKLAAGASQEQLTDEEKKVWSEVDETQGDYWDIEGGGCSWYCGGGPDEVTASSALKAQGTNTYEGKNAHDLSYKNAWVEGVPGYGVGEYLLYKFAPASARVTDVIVVNGYVKSERAYLDNSRVKKLKMYLNDQPFAILHLEDQRSKQRFRFEPIGNGNRQDAAALKLPGWTLKFEILEVYKGLKYDDVVITEIFFDGIDVH